MAVMPLRVLDRRRHASAGERAASFFDDHARMVLGLCRLLLHDGPEAEDAAQQTFLSAYRSLLAGVAPQEPAAWLAAIARNECRARIRHRRCRPAPITLEAVPDLGDPLADPAVAADEREEVTRLKDAVSALPPRQRQAVVLRDFYGLSYREVAAALEASPQIVEALLFRARGRLRDVLGRAPRYARTPLVLPLALREELAGLIPGFEAAAPATGFAAGGAGAGFLAKLTSTPAAAKIAASVAAVAAGAAAGSELRGIAPKASASGGVAAQGGEGSASSSSRASLRAALTRSSRRAVVAAGEGTERGASARRRTSRESDDGASGEGERSRESDSSGSGSAGSGDGERESSGSGSSGSGSGDAETSGSSGSGSSGSGSSGSGSGDSGGSASGSSGSSGSGSGSTSSSSSGSGGGSGSSESSGSGSGSSDAVAEPDDD